jgi:anhydro-N-acetylmuramic acid kinase
MKKLLRKNEMIVAGMMSGTSADGINVALVRLKGPPAERSAEGRIELLGHAEYAYPKKVRAAVLAAMNAKQASVADLARLSFLLGELYSDAVLATEKLSRRKVQLVGCHGQTLYHQSESKNFLGHKIAATWQTGEGAIIAARTGVPVVADFRPADMAAGGKGAPLVPFLDYMLFRDARIGRIVQNIGGIANLTAIPAGAEASDVYAFDTGPGNMVMDAVTEELFGRRFDRGGKIAASGKVLDKLIDKLLRRNFFRQPPPKTAGREEFGREFVAEFLSSCSSCRKQDVVATATALTARSIADAIRQFVLLIPKPASQRAFHEMILSGGGAKNTTLLKMLAAEITPLGLRLRISDEFGLPSAAKEAVAFAVLAYETWHRRPSNLVSATGANRGAILGKISYP